MSRHLDTLVGWIEAQPSLTLSEMSERLEAEHGVSSTTSGLCKLLRRSGYTYKKSMLASEAVRGHHRERRHDWITKRQPFMATRRHRLVFIDGKAVEQSHCDCPPNAVNTKLYRVRGRGLKGERIRDTGPMGGWKTHTFIAGLREQSLVAPWVLDGPMNKAAFESYVATQLVPALNPGDVVVLDNLSSHKSAKATECLKQAGCWFLFLPAYSPNLNPIEMAFSKLKAHLRRIGARTSDDLQDAIASVLDLFSPEECDNYFDAAGYGLI